MCGIFGQWKAEGADAALVERMAIRLAHRGPDGYGTYHAGRLAFGAGRLAIIDLAAPAGPIFNEDRRVSVVFNGEIYNYKKLRAELEELGHHFVTQTDTEVIVHGYEAWGEAVISRLRGMFALGVWDETRERLLLARDRLGEKPLYYLSLEGEFLFASEIKALFERPGLRRAVNDTALLNYLALGYTPAPLTMFQGIEKLAAGEALIVEGGQLHKRRYWQAVMDAAEPVDYQEAVRLVRQGLVEAVEMRLMSDVPIGAFLSGGVDSTAVVAIMSRALGRPVQTFTVGFDMESGSKADTKFNVDTRYAALAAEHLKTDHRAIIIKQNAFLPDLLTNLIYALDEPVAEQAIFQTAYVAALARVTGVPVLLTGDCGDELFMGYDHFRRDRLLDRYLQIPGVVRDSVLTPALERLPARFDGLRKLAQKSRATDYINRYLAWKRLADPAQLPELMANQDSAARAHDAVGESLLPLLAAPNSRYFADRLAFTGLHSWITEDSNMRVDKMCMLMSVEARAPMEDHPFVELALRLPMAYKLRNGDFKTVLKDAVADLVPEAILKRPKWGFQPPTSEWLRTTLRPLVDTYLSPEYVAAVGFFQPEAVRKRVEAHFNRQSYEVWILFPLLLFHLWHALYIEQSLQMPSPIKPEELITKL